MSDKNKGPGTGKPPTKSVTVIVNGRERQVEKDELTFDELVRLAFDPVPVGPNVLFTITYRKGQGNKPEGTLIQGGSVKAHDGMIFNVTATDKS